MIALISDGLVLRKILWPSRSAERASKTRSHTRRRGTHLRHVALDTRGGRALGCPILPGAEQEDRTEPDFSRAPHSRWRWTGWVGCAPSNSKAARIPWVDEQAVESAAIDFLGRFLADREAGRVRPLDEYLSLYPGIRESVAREYLRLCSDAADCRAGTTMRASPSCSRRFAPHRSKAAALSHPNRRHP